MRFFQKRQPGVHPNPSKTTVNTQIQLLKEIPFVRVPMRMQIGPSAVPCVSVGDTVRVGQLIGRADAPMAVPVHASVSGEVMGITKEMQSNGSECDVVQIKNDGLFTPFEPLQIPQINSQEDFLTAVREAGLVGLGGAGFPTHIKLKFPPDCPVDTLLVNGMECEPYLTTDARVIEEHSDAILNGVAMIMKWCGVERCLIGMEDNEPHAFEMMTQALNDRSDLKNVTLKQLPSLYPQGAEKVLIRNLTGREVPSGGLPAHVGCVVMNVTTLYMMDRYFKTGMPLVERLLTLDGPAIKTPGLFRVPIGTPISELLKAAGTQSKVADKVIMGGPMMGVSVYDLESPILKVNNGILAFDPESSAMPPESACIRCGRCVSVCPMNLIPVKLDHFARKGSVDGLKDFAVNDCIECGSCTYICPAKRYLVQNIRLGKALVRRATPKPAPKPTPDKKEEKA